MNINDVESPGTPLSGVSAYMRFSVELPKEAGTYSLILKPTLLNSSSMSTSLICTASKIFEDIPEGLDNLDLAELFSQSTEFLNITAGYVPKSFWKILDFGGGNSDRRGCVFIGGTMGMFRSPDGYSMGRDGWKVSIESAIYPRLTECNDHPPIYDMFYAKQLIVNQELVNLNPEDRGSRIISILKRDFKRQYRFLRLKPGTTHHYTL